MIKNIKDAQAEKNDVNGVIDSAYQEGYEEIFIIGVKDRRIHFTNSGYAEIERKIGLLEMLKAQMLERSE